MSFNEGSLIVIAAGVLIAGGFPLLFWKFFKKQPELKVAKNISPVEESSEAIMNRIERLGDRLDEDTQKLRVIQGWFEDFEDLAEWMRVQGMWDAEDIDIDHPMNTYRKGLERFLKEHKIEIKK